jgi:hypothetical protein
MRKGREEMSMKEFVRKHSKEIDAYIARALGRKSNPIPTYEERRLWVLNDEFLYNWARSKGVG